MRRVVALFLVIAGLAGCGVSDDEAEVRAVTERFYAAIREDDGATACELLGAETAKAIESQSGQGCDDVITRLEFEGGEVEGAVVYITNAKVDLSGGESAFLGKEADGWKLTGLACKPMPDMPFECEVEA